MAIHIVDTGGNQGSVRMDCLQEFCGSGILAYIIAAIVIPEEENSAVYPDNMNS